MELQQGERPKVTELQQQLVEFNKHHHDVNLEGLREELTQLESSITDMTDRYM